MPYARKGEGLHLPPVPEALRFACPDIKYPREGCPSAGPYTPRHFAVTCNARVPPRHVANLRRRDHLAGHVTRTDGRSKGFKQPRSYIGELPASIALTRMTKACQHGRGPSSSGQIGLLVLTFEQKKACQHV
jgi:hypothetical protein